MCASPQTAAVTVVYVANSDNLTMKASRAVSNRAEQLGSQESGDQI
jgi:hypothetical protein